MKEATNQSISPNIGESINENNHQVIDQLANMMRIEFPPISIKLYPLHIIYYSKYQLQQS